MHLTTAVRFFLVVLLMARSTSIVCAMPLQAPPPIESAFMFIDYQGTARPESLCLPRNEAIQQGSRVKRVIQILAKMAFQLEITANLRQSSSFGLFPGTYGKRDWVFFKFVGGKHCPEEAGCIGWIAKGRANTQDYIDYAAIVVENQERGVERGIRAARFKPVALYTSVLGEREEAAGTVSLNKEESMKQDAELRAVQRLRYEDFEKHVETTLSASQKQWSEIMYELDKTLMTEVTDVAKHIASIHRSAITTTFRC